MKLEWPYNAQLQQIDATLGTLTQAIIALQQIGTHIMAELDDLNAAQAKLAADVTAENTEITTAIAAGQAASSALKAQLAALQTQVAALIAAGTVPPGTLEGIATALSATDANVTAMTAAVTAAAATL